MLISLLLYYFSYCTYYSIYTHSVRSVLVLCNGTVRVRTAAVVRRYTVLVHYCTAETNRTPHNAHHLPASQSVRFILPPAVPHRKIFPHAPANPWEPHSQNADWIESHSRSWSGLISIVTLEIVNLCLPLLSAQAFDGCPFQP